MNRLGRNLRSWRVNIGAQSWILMPESPFWRAGKGAYWSPALRRTEGCTHLRPQARRQTGRIALVVLLGGAEAGELDVEEAGIVLAPQQGAEHRVRVRPGQAAPYDGASVVDDEAEAPRQAMSAAARPTAGPEPHPRVSGRSTARARFRRPSPTCTAHSPQLPFACRIAIP